MPLQETDTDYKGVEMNDAAESSVGPLVPVDMNQEQIEQVQSQIRKYYSLLGELKAQSWMLKKYGLNVERL